MILPTPLTNLLLPTSAEAHCPQQSPAPFMAPTCYLSHIPLQPSTKEDDQAIPTSLKSCLSCWRLRCSLLSLPHHLPTLIKEYIHTIYYTHLTYCMMLPTALTLRVHNVQTYNQLSNLQIDH